MPVTNKLKTGNGSRQAAVRCTARETIANPSVLSRRAQAWWICFFLFFFNNHLIENLHAYWILVPT